MTFPPDSWNHLGRLQLQWVREAEEMRRALNPMVSLTDSIRRNQELWINQIQGVSGMLEWQESLSGILGGFQSSQALLQGIQLETTRWSDLLAGMSGGLAAYDLQALSLPATIWQDSLLDIAQSFDKLRLPDTFPTLSHHLLAPHQEFSSFGRSVIASLGDGVDDHEEAALSGALLLAEEQITGSTEITAEFLSEFDPSDGSDVSAPLPVVNIFDTQRTQLLAQASVLDAYTVGDLILLSASARLNSLARRVAEGVVRCNRAARLAGQDEVFTPTTTFLDAQSRLQWLAAQDEEDMGNVVDALYFMFYEGAGAGELRLLKYVGDSDCEIVWIIKHLRNKLYRHDPDHGSDSSQDKSWRDLAEVVRALGFTRMPTTAEGFQKMQEVLLKRARDFLERLLDGIPGVDA